MISFKSNIPDSPATQIWSSLHWFLPKNNLPPMRCRVGPCLLSSRLMFLSLLSIYLGRFPHFREISISGISLGDWWAHHQPKGLFYNCTAWNFFKSLAFPTDLTVLSAHIMISRFFCAPLRIQTHLL